jgi:hypothetical protein
MKKNEKSPLEMLAEERKNADLPHVSPENHSVKYEGVRRKVTFFAVLLSLAAVMLVFTAVAFGGVKREKERAEEVRFNDFSELARGRVVGDIKSAMNNPKSSKNHVPETEEKHAEAAPKAVVPKKRNKNEEKDREILEAYAKMSDAAASDATQTARKRRFVPGGESSGGGVFVKVKKEVGGKDNIFALHDVKVKVKLDFSIRSTAQSTVVATVLEEVGEIPKGARFYGSAKSFVNKRTQLAFSKLIIGKEEFSVKGFAVSGKDPGIESEVTDIADENIKSEVKQGITKTAGAVVSRLAGSVGSTAGAAAANTVNPATAELSKQEEANKMKQEYRVPAGTSFFVYLE